MKNKKMHKISGALSYVLILSLLFSGFTPAETVNKEPPVINDELMFPDIVDAAEAKENDYVSRVKAAEKDLYTFVFANSDGTNTMRVYSHPVKYIADDGSVRDISLDIKAKKGGGFVTADHEITTTFESKLTEGISLGYNDVEITLVPTLGLGTAPTAKLSSDGKAVTYQMNEDTFFVYQLTYAGFKEDIVVEKYTGQTEYEFSLFTSGLTLCEEYGSYYLADVEGNVRATLGDIIVFTADERNNARGGLSYEVVRANQEYRLTIHLDADYLADEKTMYPIRIDPTIEINYDNSGAGAIEDVSIIQNATFNGTSGSLFVGRFPATSLTRILMRFPNLSLNELEPEQVTAATVELRDLMCQDDEDITVECCIYDISAPAWSEGGTTTWSSVGTNYLGSVLDSHLISYGQGNVSDHRYSFNIVTAAKAWADGTQSPAKGLVFKANSAFENQGGTNVDVWRKTFASYNRTEYQPSLSISYIDFAADAESISADILTPVTIPSDGTKMKFEFSPVTTGFYTFESSDIVYGNPMGWLYNYNFETLLSNNDTSGSNFRMTYHLIAGYKYYFMAGCYPSGSGSYSVKVIKTTNPFHITANAISWGDSKVVSNPYEDSATAFKFTPSVTGEYLLYSVGTNGDPKVWIYNSNLNLAVVDDDGAGNKNSRLTFTFTAGSTYYIAAGHFGSNFGSYEVAVLLSAHIEDGVHRLKNEGTDQYMDIDGPGAQEWVHQWSFHTDLQERWKFQKQSDGSYALQSEYGDKKYVGVSNGTVGSNNIKLYSSVSGNTKWTVYANPSGQLFLEPGNYPGTVLYVPNSLEGTELQLQHLSYDASSRHTWRFEVKSDIVPEGQQMSLWCWATSARMFSMHYYDMVSRTQKEAVIHVKGKLTNSGGWEDEIRDAVLFYTGNVAENQLNLDYCKSKNKELCRIFPEATLRRFLDDGHVVCITRSWYPDGHTRTGGHAYVVSGYTTTCMDGEIKYQYFLLNPMPLGNPQPGEEKPIVTTGREMVVSYQWICNGRNSFSFDERDSGIWEGFVVVNTSYSNNTALPVYN